jgi:acyl-CoA synthetase (AMP-forming)/AMP-acid ligase II
MISYNPLIQSLAALAQTNPGFVVLYDKATLVTAGDLFERSLKVASGLAAMGFEKNHIAVIACEPGEEFLEIMNAVIMLRGKIAIIDPEMGAQNYAAKMQQLNPQWMFIDSRILFLHEHPMIKKILLNLGRKMPGLAIIHDLRLISVGRKMPIFKNHINFPKLYTASSKLFENGSDPGDAENVIIYTSGTLAVPKGVLHTGKTLGASIHAIRNLLKVNPGTIVGATLPHFMLLGITAGMPVKIKKKGISVATEIRWLDKEKIGVLFGPPSDYLPLIQYCEVNNRKLPASLQHVLIGSAPVHVRFLKRFISVLPDHTRVTCMYGMTENLLLCTMDGRIKKDFKGSGDLVGKPVAGVSIKFEEDGEILVKSDQKFSRYFHEKESGSWHASGDLGELDDQGNLILRGRKKEMIIRRNMNIYPALYENTIKNIKGIEEAAMVGVYDENIQDEKVYLALEGSDLNMPHIQNELNQGKYCIDREALPDHIFRMIIPRKGRQNKIDRASIVEYIKNNAL